MVRRAAALAAVATGLTGAAAAQAATEPSVTAEQAQRLLRCTDDVHGATRDPVLLIPGTTVDTRQDFSFSWEPALRAAGRPYCTYDPPASGMADIQVSGEYVVRQLHRIHALSGRKVDVVGHSQGGMVTRWALRFFPDTRALVDDVIGLAPSNHGTVVARPLCGLPGGCAPSIWQQRDDSRFMRALNSEAETWAGIDYTVVYSHTDEVVVPNADARTGSSALRTGEGRITNVAIQELCPLDLNEHLLLGVLDHVAYSLAIDALDHDGPADPSRVSRGVCRSTTMPSVDRPLGALSTLDSAAFLAKTLLTARRVGAEPALKDYAAAAGKRARAARAPARRRVSG
ncbi:hypothetical protein [Conexibacter sp. SYSU D00693]|uniref:lipase family alpha/beta hydrolase n=1 Tax=Conexibacter sp. SYSU D00693 TaxID=2812560 RepID=UPI00196BAE85|nr:hypothetical protein [Conexibacter sp. SYSU D00693]